MREGGQGETQRYRSPQSPPPVTPDPPLTTPPVAPLSSPPNPPLPKPPKPPKTQKFFGGGRWVKEQVDDVGDLLKVGKDEGLVFVLKLASRLAASSGPFCLSVSRRTRCCSGNSHSRWREVLVLRFTLRCSVPSHTPRCPLAASPRCAPDSGCASASGCARRSPRRTPNLYVLPRCTC